MSPSLRLTAPDPEVVLDGEVGERAPALGDVGDAEPGDRLRALAGDALAGEGDVARSWGSRR